MIQRYVLLFVFLFSALACWAQPPSPTAIPVYNVRDFGAKGDGKADDTAAIQAAFDVAGKVMLNVSAAKTGALHAFSSPAVFFPSGEYLLSDTLQIKGINIKGDPYAVLRQTNPDKGIFATRWAYYLNISGLTFVGGQVQLDLYNGNLSGGVINISECTFQSAMDVALNADFESTNLTLERCNFFKCMQGMRLNRIDVVVIRDCWMDNHPDMKYKAFIENRAQRVFMDNICANPQVNGFDQRWIDNYGTNLTCRQIRFGGEGGGFTPIVNFSKPNPISIGRSILVEDSWCCNTSNLKRDAVVYCEEIPNSITLRGNTTTAANLIKVSEKIDLKTYFKEQKTPASMLAFGLSGNIGGLIDNVLPSGLAKPAAVADNALPPISAKAVKAMVKQAVQEWTEKAVPDLAEGEFKGHVMRTDPAQYQEVTLKNARWELGENIDATRLNNHEFLTFAQASTDILMIWKREGDLWPMFSIYDIEVDLDRTPYLAWNTKKAGAPPGFTVRVIVPEQGIAVTITDTQWSDYQYHAYDLRKILNLTGKQTLGLRFYPSSWGWVPGKGYNAHNAKDTMWSAPAGSYAVFDFIRFEAE
jgi:hypothetical protein